MPVGSHRVLLRRSTASPTSAALDSGTAGDDIGQVPRRHGCDVTAQLAQKSTDPGPVGVTGPNRHERQRAALINGHRFGDRHHPRRTHRSRARPDPQEIQNPAHGHRVAPAIDSDQDLEREPRIVECLDATAVRCCLDHVRHTD
jgi:hypothetical protein